MFILKKMNEKIPYGWEEIYGKYRFISSKDDKNEIDVLVVMAGGLDEKGSIHPWVEKRLDLVLEIYKKKKIPVICTGGGTYHKPPLLNENKYVIHESTACAEYLIRNGVESKDIYKEWASYDTIASIYFTFLFHIFPMKWEKIGVVTSSFHMPRVSLLFHWIGSLHGHYYCVFLESCNNMNKNVLEVRKSREKKSFLNVENLRKKINDKNSFHKWLFTEHKAYSCNFLFHKEVIPEKEKITY
jgi:vancomycin permeability regulator SanA